MIKEPPIIYQAKIHWIANVLPSIYIAIGSLGIFPLLITKTIAIQIIALALVYLFFKGLLRIFRNKATSIVVTEGFLSISTGIFGKTISDISLRKMEGMQLSQNFLGRQLNFGTLLVTTGEVTQKYMIADPSILRNMIINQQ